MSGLGSWLLNVFSATNENSAALGSLKIDFSLFKIEAPIEFNGIASALSASRRVEAEEGPSHKTARRLGALFEDLVPSTPKLISAYGLRMTEIMNTSGINDVGRSEHGPFEAYVGADGTTLWAAATSGIAALGVYLLSCLLARAWDAKTATAIWVELVAARRNEIKEGLRNNHNISESSVVGALQDITRQDLALWDSSARAWLRRADKAKEWSQCQLSLVVKNIKIPISGGPSTYEKVINAWKRSMLAVEQLLSGKPQEISDGSAFLAFSAWHIYPDLIVLGAEPKKVEFRDKLVPSTGVGTVGVQSRSSEKEGIQWSLALSHLQYYGEPVVVRSDQDYSRLTFAQLQIVALGGLLGKWRISPRDYLLVAEWFKLLWSRMGMPEENIKSGSSSELGWLLHLVVAANRLLTSSDQDHQQNLILLKHGSRRAKFFLCDHDYTPPPLFGLTNTLTICGLQENLDIESGVAYLRAAAEKLGMKAYDAIICCAPNASDKYHASHVDYFEIATTKTIGQGVHVRWICPKGESKVHQLTRASFHSYGGIEDQDSVLSDRLRYISERGERCEIYATGLTFDPSANRFEWLDPPTLYQQNCSGAEEYDRDAIRQPKRAKKNVSFDAVIGNWRFGLFLRSEARRKDDLLVYGNKVKSETTMTGSFSAAIRSFNDTETQPERLKDYLCSLIHISEEQSNKNSLSAPGVSLFSNAHKFHRSFGESLYALDSASKIYNHLGPATISLKLIARPLCNSAWFRSLSQRWEDGHKDTFTWFEQTARTRSPQFPLPDRHETFSCIALFDSGRVDLNPEDFEHSFALCSEDTIYVPTALLSDPFALVSNHEMKSITGNIGRQGISILVSPFEPRIRELSDSYNLVKHEPYDLKREDNFRETSLHLSFTDWTFPLSAEDSRMIDHDAQVVEAVISVHDRGRWVADIDILKVDFKNMLRFEPKKNCDKHHGESCDVDYTSIDSWEELLDEPRGVGIVRAHGNWAARLAAVSILSRNEAGGNNFGVFGPEPFCLKCLEEAYESPFWNMLDHESALPSFCID